MTRDEQDSLDPDVLAALLEAGSPMPPPPGLRGKVLDRARRAGRMDATVVRAGEGAWRTVDEGIEVKTLLYDRAADSVTFLLRAAPGASLPGHAHHAVEECLVLEGEFIIGDVTLRAGDFQYGNQGEAHPRAYTETGVLVYLRGSALDYPFACPA